MSPIVGGDLGDDRSDCIVRSISLNDNGVVRVEMHQDGGLCEGRFEGLQTPWCGRGPDERGILSGKANQGDDDVGEPLNESTIKVGETQECLDCFEVSRVSQTLTASVLAVSIEMPVGVTIKPRNSIFCMWNRHFSGLECSRICEDVPRLVGHEPDALPMSRRI